MYYVRQWTDDTPIYYYYKTKEAAFEKFVELTAEFYCDIDNSVENCSLSKYISECVKYDCYDDIEEVIMEEIKFEDE